MQVNVQKIEVLGRLQLPLYAPPIFLFVMLVLDVFHVNVQLCVHSCFQSLIILHLFFFFMLYFHLLTFGCIILIFHEWLQVVVFLMNIPFHGFISSLFAFFSV